MIKKLISIIFSVVMLISFGACSISDKKNNGDKIYSGKTLFIEARLSGYGQWLDEFAADFASTTGCEVDINWNSKANEEARNIFNSSSYVLSDLYFVSVPDLWYSWAKNDQLYKIQGFDDILQEEYVDYGTYNDKRYNLNVLTPPVGLVYNVEYIKKIPSKGEFIQGTFPQSFQGLLDMCDSINEAAIKNGSNTVSPFSWGGKTSELSEYFFRMLWAQGNAGKDFSDYLNQDGSVPDEEVFKSQGLKDALTAMSKLINSDGSYSKNSIRGCGEMDNIDSQSAFLRGDVVFCATGGWFEYEMKNYINDDSFEYAFSNMPLYNEAENQRSVLINIPSESFFIPKVAENTDIALAFLQYVFSADNAAEIHKAIGTPLAIEYEFGKNDYDSLKTDFARQVAKVVEESIPVTKGSNNIMYYSGGVSGTILTSNGSTINDIFTVKMLKNQSNYTINDIDTILNNNYLGYVTMWNDKLEHAGLR